MPDLRDIVKTELRRRNWSNNHLGVSLRGLHPTKPGADIPVATVQDWLSGRTPSINSLYLGVIFDVLELTVTRNTSRPRKRSQ